MRKIYLFLPVVFLILLNGCYPEYRIAKSYIESKPEIAILILPVNYVFKENLKQVESHGSDKLSEEELGNLKFEKSQFLKNISDSVFLETFINSMVEEFDALGFKVFFEPQLDSFLSLQTDAYILSIAQISLEEHYIEHKDEEVFGSYNYIKKIDLNALTYNFWFELSKVNDPEAETQLLFVTESLSDRIDGFFNQNIITGDVKYKYNIRELDLDAIYRFCDTFGQRYAGYTFDLFMNNYLKKAWSNGIEPQYYMQYKRWNNTLDMTTKDRFILMEE